MTPAGRQKRILHLVIAALCAMLLLDSSPMHASPRLELSADSGWKFTLGDPAGAEAVQLPDETWRSVDLPHDWSIEGKPAKENPSGGSGGYFPAGIGWYRKAFTAPAAWRGRHVSLEFDGVASNATVYLNGHRLGVHPYAYTSFGFDLTPQLNFQGRNVLAVRVDTSAQPDGRWYSGAGIYRHVRVTVTQPVHLDRWGVFITTPNVARDAALVSIHTAVVNESDKPASIFIETTLYDRGGKASGKASSRLTIAAGAEGNAQQSVKVTNPALWSPASPVMYRAVSQVKLKRKLVDQGETPFGIRSLAWSAENGFLLNGSPIKLAGGSVHHDNGPLGAEAFDRAEVRKAELLKAAGFNAVRTAHNPPSPAFLDACDRIGLLVIDEPFDVWTVSKRTYDYARFFKEWWQKDVDAMVKRDRNHPSIIMWGIGNEIPEVWTPDGAPLAKELSERVRSLDPSRPLTQAFPGATYGANPDAAIAQIDIAGYNYNLAQNQSEDHRRIPSRIMMTTESFPADAYEQWKLAQENPYILGEFVWTAMDYLGESGIGAWSYGSVKQGDQLKQMRSFLRVYLARMGADGKNPMAAFQNGQPPSPLAPEFPWHGSYCGDLDITGFRKPASYYRDILWNGGDRIFATVRLPEPEGQSILAAGWAVYPTLPSWNWPGQEGKPLQVEVYSGVEKVRLYLNDRLLEEKQSGREQQFKAAFSVPYEPGVLRAVGLRGDRIVTETVLTTAGPASALRLTADRTAVDANGQDLSYITVEAIDAKGNLQQNADQEISFSITGPGTLAAVGNGNTEDQTSYRDEHRHLFHGRALVIVRTTRQSGSIRVAAATAGLEDTSIAIEAKPAGLTAELR